MDGGTSLAAGSLTITTHTLPQAVTGKPYSVQLEATGGTAPFGWTLMASPEEVRNWLVLGRDGNLGEGQPPDKVVAPPGAPLVVQVQDSLGQAAQVQLSLVVTCDPAVAVACGAPDSTGTMCLAGEEQCVNGALSTCQPVGGQVPSSDVRYCGSTCQNCGGSGDHCSQGLCACGDAPACGHNDTCCPGPDGGTCVDFQTDPHHCSSCGNDCAAQEGGRQNVVPLCDAGACAFACESGYTHCVGSTSAPPDPHLGCPDSLSSPTHCGTCGNDCLALPYVADAGCSSGSCQLQCQSGWANCDGNIQNGCEQNVASDVNHCGPSCAPCPVGPNVTGVACVNGTCQITACAQDYADCDHIVSNGCEADLTSRATCGSCTLHCGSMYVCAGNSCCLPSKYNPC